MAALDRVRAAGGVVWRLGVDGALEVLLVHRPRYNDWSLPKGKLDPGESDEDCARREVAEETGLSCSLGVELPIQRYVDHMGRDKVVRYWAMSVVAGEGRLEHEVDAVDWLPLVEARSRLTYERDIEVLNALAEAPL